MWIMGWLEARIKREETNQKVTVAHGRDGGGLVWESGRRDGNKMTYLIPNNLKKLTRLQNRIPDESDSW